VIDGSKRPSRGCAGGLPGADVKVAIVDGTFHEVDSSELAFRWRASSR